MRLRKTSSLNVIDSLPAKPFTFFIKSKFSSLPEPGETDPYNMSFDEATMLYHCVILSKAVYLLPRERILPDVIKKIIVDSRESDLYVIPYLVVDSPELNKIFISCRGSYCFNDFMVDIKGEAVEFYNGLIHQGVLQTSLNLRNAIYNIVKETHEKTPDKEIIMTGHSLGGGCAAAVNEMFHHEFPGINMRCVCFAPCASFSSEIARGMKSKCKSYIMQGDFVPYCTFRNVIELPPSTLPSTIDSYLKGLIKKRLRKLKYSPKLVPYDYNPFETPPPPLSNILNDEIDMFIKPVQLYPPGECYIMALMGNQNEIIEIRKVKDDEYFSKFTKNLYELRHMMNFYRDKVTDFYEHFLLQSSR